jgi:hypothetical protein
MIWSPSATVPFSSMQDDPVRVPVEADPDIGAHIPDLRRRRPGRRGADAVVDVVPVG